MLKLSLVIPCYNEAANLPLLVNRCRAVFTDKPVEVILVDNGSVDASADVLRGLLAGQKQIRNVHVPVNRGYGFGVLSGLNAAGGDVLAWTHADLQTDPADAWTGFELFARGDDPRRLYVKGRRRGRPVGDRIFTVGMSVFETVLLGRVLSDVNAQPNLFSRTFFETWRDPPHDFSLDLFAYYMAVRQGLVVRRFPVRFGARAHGVSHWNVNWSGKRKFIRRTVDYSLTLRASLRRRDRRKPDRAPERMDG